MNMNRESCMNDKKVSIIIPVYNIEKYLSKCVDSLIAQEYPNYEIILLVQRIINNCYIKQRPLHLH